MMEKSKKTQPFSWIKDVKKRKDEGRDLCEDYFTDSTKVTPLTADSYQQYLKDNDIVLVMFHDPCDKNCLVSKGHFVNAALLTEKEKREFAAVDCTREPGLCDQQEVKTIPSFKLYSKGRVAATVTEYYTFNSNRMRAFVENCPVFGEEADPTAGTSKREGCQSNPKVADSEKVCVKKVAPT